MKTKHITKIIMLSALIFSTPTFTAQNNPITSMIMGSINNVRNWTNSFYTTCRDVGILATLYATVGIYDFNKITGLDENQLDTYDIQQLKTAQKRVDTMNQYALRSSALNVLNKFSTTIQGKIHQKEDIKEEQIPYDEAQAHKDVEEMMRTKK